MNKFTTNEQTNGKRSMAELKADVRRVTNDVKSEIDKWQREALAKLAQPDVDKQWHQALCVWLCDADTLLVRFDAGSAGEMIHAPIRLHSNSISARMLGPEQLEVMMELNDEDFTKEDRMMYVGKFSVAWDEEEMK
jgi:hypothetical protein